MLINSTNATNGNDSQESDNLGGCLAILRAGENFLIVELIKLDSL